MITSAICSVNGISSQNPRPHASTTCAGVDGVTPSAGDDDDHRGEQREDEGVGDPALGPGGERQRQSGDRASPFVALGGVGTAVLIRTRAPGGGRGTDGLTNRGGGTFDRDLTSLALAMLRDTRDGARRLARDWRFTSGAVLLLGLGIGANTAIFSLINATLFRQQSVAEPDRLVDIYQNGTNAEGIDANSYPAYLDMAAYTDVFASTTAVFVPRGVNYLENGRLRPAVAEHATASYLSVLGLRPSLGRWFDAAEDTAGAAVVTVVGYDTWTRRFNADPAVIGRVSQSKVFRSRSWGLARADTGGRSISASSQTSGCRSDRCRLSARHRARSSAARRKRRCL